MATDQEVLQSLANLISKQSGGPTYSSGDTARDEKARAREAAKIMSDEMQKGMKNFPKQFRSEMDESTNKLAKALASNVKDVQGSLRVKDQIVAIKEITNEIKNISKQKNISEEKLTESLENLEERAAKAGLTLEQLGIKTNKNTKTIENADEVVAELTETMEELDDGVSRANVATKQLGDTSVKLKKGFSALWGILKKSAKLFETELRYSMERGTADAGYIAGVTTLGISQIAYAKILASSRHTQLAMSSAGLDFKEGLIQNTDRLKRFTSTNEEATQAANLYRVIGARMGVSQENLTDVVESQTNMYLKFGRSLSMSAVEMGKFTQEMMADKDIRIEVMRLREDERQSFVLGLAARNAEYKTMGYTNERAKAVQKTFAALAGMNPKERMKQSAKRRAMMGAMGLGAEGAELMQLEMKYQTMNKTEKKAADIKMASLRAQGANKLLELTGSGATPESAFAFSMLSDVTNFNENVDKFETKSGKGLQVDMSKLENQGQESNDYLKTIANWTDTYRAAGASGLGSLGTGALGIAGGMGAQYFGGKLAGKAGPRMAKMATGAMGGISSMFSGAAGAGAKGVGSAFKGAKIAAGFGKAALKSGIKKIPVIGALASLGFAASRAASGDWLGAAMEVASGAAAIIPGIGTAASFGIDAALLSRDMSGSDGTNTDTAAVPKMVIQETEMQMTERSQLISTLQSINQYLIASGELNSEQVKSLDNTGKSIDKAVNYGKVDQIVVGKRMGQS